MELTAIGEPEQPSPEDFKFYETQLAGKVKMYMQKLLPELEKVHGKYTLIRKGFIVQEVLDALGLEVGQVSRVTSNIKRGMAMAKAAQARTGGTPIRTF